MSIVEQFSHVNSQSEADCGFVKCSHCGLAVPQGLIETGSREQFCCQGCRTAYQLIHSCGLDAFYSMSASDDVGREALRRDQGNSESRFEEFDQPLFQEKFARTVGVDDREILFLLDGIHCAACIWLIEKLPLLVPGVLDVKINWARQTALVRWSPQATQLSQIAKTLYQLGYMPHPNRESGNESRRQLENRQQLTRIGIAAATAGNNMLIATALYLGLFSYMATDITQLLRMASAAVGMVSLFWPGRVFLQGAINAIRTRTPHMDLPIALGLTIGFSAGLINTLRGSGEIYFDSLSVLIFLLLVGRWIQFRQQRQAADAIEMLYRLTPKFTHKLVNGCPVEALVDLIQAGDLLEIRAGDLFPVDGLIVNGSTEVDESILSGESQALVKSIGNRVLAGTQNKKSVVTVKTTATGRETRLSKIVELVEQSSLDNPEIVQWANRIGGYFVSAVIVLAGLTFGSWLLIDAGVAVDRAVALLIVACPCALALATPLAISVALGRAAKQGLMIKGGNVLEFLNRPGMIWLDKTGTLTEGKLEVVNWQGDSIYQRIVAAMESHSSHPVAQALVAFARGNNQNPAASSIVEDIAELGDGGICGTVDDEQILIGKESFLRLRHVRIESRWREVAEQILRSGCAPCWVAANGNVVAVASLGDMIRVDTRLTIDQLKNAGWKIGILSGDHQGIVNQVASRLGIEGSVALGGLNPEDKLGIIRQSCDKFSTVVMVGDGVNDSAALAAATVGIAVHKGAEASLAAAPVYLARQGLKPILQLIEISNSTVKTIRRNFVASIGYNAFGATLAAIGWINPLIAAILMPISSLTVVAISLSAGKALNGKKRK